MSRQIFIEQATTNIMPRLTIAVEETKKIKAIKLVRYLSTEQNWVEISTVGYSWTKMSPNEWRITINSTLENMQMDVQNVEITAKVVAIN